jgi:hypothetical protein
MRNLLFLAIALKPMRQEVRLQFGREPLQIPASEFTGDRSNPDMEDIWISRDPVALTLEEIKWVEAFILTLPYRQAIVRGAVLLDEDDPLLGLDHDALDKVEVEAVLPNSKFAPGAGMRSPTERALIIRERGYLGAGLKQLSGVIE